MYIWRGKNRRDKRNLLIGGDLFWGAEKGAKNFEHEDNVLRLELEEKHVAYYGKKVRALMTQYLQTVNGKREVELLLTELDKNLQYTSMLALTDDEDANETLKANVFNIYQQFCLPETTYIDKEGLMKLFSDLQLTLSKREFDKYAKKLNLQSKGAAVDFDGFFDGKQAQQSALTENPASNTCCTAITAVLMENLQETAKAKTSSFSFVQKSAETKEKEKDASLAYKMQRRLQENAAKLILIDHAVYTVEQEALEEYRKAHPSLHTCDQCNKGFVDAHELRTHSRYAELHRELARKKNTSEERFTCVDVIFQGNQGRHLRANRLMHSGELGSLRTRIEVAVEDPYRPNIADAGGKRYAQQMAGAMVTGYDAKCGVRPNHKRYGLIRQHLAPQRQKTNVNSLFQVTQPQLQEVIHHLLRCKDDFIDTVSTCDNPHNQLTNASKLDLEPLTERDTGRRSARSGKSEEGDGEEVFTQPHNSHGMCAIVRFQWNMFADNQVYIIGEFTGWKREEMVCSMRTNKFTIYKQLSPGRYRYRFVIDGVERVDEVASKVPDPKGPGGFTNEILVTNTPLYHKHTQPTGVASPLQAATRQHAVDKLGLLVPPSSSGKTGSVKMSASTGRRTPALGMPGFAPDSERSGTSNEGGALQNAEGDDSEFDQRSVGEIVHISQSDREGLIRHLKHIQLRNVALYDDGAWALASYINRNKFIQIVDLSYNNISDDGIQGFCGCLPLLEALHTLKLNGNGFAMDACRYLTDNLAASTTLTCLELANNRIGDDGMEVLCNFMKHNEYLEHLYVDTCLIGDDGVQCLHDALLFNRRLKSISLMSNRFTVKGMMALGKALQYNASLTALVLSNNPIGPEAANSIGSSLTVNDTLTRLELCNIDLLAHCSTYGLYGICAGIKQNKTLTHIDLRNNRLLDMHAINIAHVLMVNTVLTEIDLTGNTISNAWFTDYTYIPTHILPEMPSIETLIHRNRLAARHRDPNAYDASKSRYLDDVQKGKWTFRRQWKREVQSIHEKATIERQYAHEQARIDAETEYIRFHLNDIMITVREYLEQEPCHAYTRQLAKAIQQYITDLGRFDSRRHNRFNITMTDVAVIKGKNNVRNASIKLKRSASASNGLLSPSPSSRGESPGRPLSPVRSLLLPKPVEPAQFNMEHFLNAHISILHAIFSQLGGGSANSLTLSPLLLQQAFHTLALPLPLNEVQHTVDATLVRAVSAVGLHKFSDFVLSNAQRLCRENKIQRMRVLADLYFNPPAEEARTIIYDHLHHATFVELRDKYRSIPENAPLYACPECHKRFTRQKHLDKHLAKGSSSSEHRRHQMKEVIHHSQVLFLQHIKHDLTDVFYPAYYELKPAHQLPKNFYPQVFDKIGKEGRPFGVVEANRTVRVLDVFGEYLHVNLHGELGWIRYRDGKVHYLQPACANQEGFDWDKLHIQETPTYYRGKAYRDSTRAVSGALLTCCLVCCV
jgi:hypothetical protein